MDAAELAQLIAIATLLAIAIRRGLRTLDQAESGFASLFVPPDRTLPWPRGVQESDAPWGWRKPLETIDAIEPAGVADLDIRITPLPITHIGTYVVDRRPVAPIHFRALPQ